MRATHISVIHRPDDPRIFHKQCNSLVRAGYEVHLIASGPPLKVDGVQRHSVARDQSRPPARREWARIARAVGHAARLWPSVYHLHDPHLIPLGLALKLGGSRIIYDVHEDYPAHARSKLADHPMRGRLKALMWSVLERLARRCFDGFVCASPSLAATFPSSRTTVVSNFPIAEQFENGTPAVPYRDRPNTLVATGNLSEMRCFCEIARALELLPPELGCRLRAIGRFHPPKLEGTARTLDAWKQIDYVAWQPHTVLVRELLSAKVGLVVLRPLPNHLDAVRSTKLFEYMAAGIPVIASDLPRWREIVLGVGCGLAVDPRDPAGIARAIEYLLTHPDEGEDMGRRGRAAVSEEFNWGGDEARLLSLYRRLIGDLAPRTAPDRESVLST